MKMKVYHIETMGALDGPGIRVVVFLQGCPLKCRYCHNADSWSLDSGKAYTVIELFNLIIRYEVYMKKGGGVTFSGGEPLLQAKALLVLIKKLKERGIHIAVDTSGGIFTHETKQLLESVDLILLDVKHTDASAYYELTNWSLEPTLKTLEHLKTHHIRYWIRQVIIRNINDDENQIRDLNARTLSIYRERIELKPYKTLGQTKWSKEQEHRRLTQDDTPEKNISYLNQFLELD